MSEPNASRRAWAPHSLMAAVEADQTDANVRGRARIKDGELKASSGTRWITPADYDQQDFIIVDNFLPDADCDRLAETFRSLHDGVQDRKTNVAFWDGRIVFVREVAERAPDAAAVMADFQKRATRRLSDFYALTRPLYADSVQLNVWRRGQTLPPHSDNSHPDGSAHTSPWRDFSSIVYLNDDYQGGQLYFTAADKVLRPRKGMLVAFSAGFHHEHGVLKVRGGTRLTMPAFYTFDVARADPHIHPEARASEISRPPMWAVRRAG